MRLRTAEAWVRLPPGKLVETPNYNYISAGETGTSLAAPMGHGTLKMEYGNENCEVRSSVAERQIVALDAVGSSPAVPLEA